MTPAAKDRRKLRHALQKEYAPGFMHRMGMRSTHGSIEAAIKQWVERQVSLMRKQDFQVRPIEPSEANPQL